MGLMDRVVALTDRQHDSCTMTPFTSFRLAEQHFQWWLQQLGPGKPCSPALTCQWG